MSKLIIGLSGGIGSGKTAVSDRFKALGIYIVDADIAARTIVEPNKPAWQDIKEFFGNEVLLEDQTINRAWLRQQVFADTDKRKKLEEFTHPRIRAEIIRDLDNSNSVYTLLVSPLLIESGQIKLVEKVIIIDVPEALQIERTCTRDNNDSEQVKRIIAAQLPREKRLKHADWVIDNSEPLETLDTRIESLHQELLTLI
ncbi:dephospho-CoA kinase [Oleispira antarctica]|uniref:Dephospho-CoA kinase n=1 Tax=Oleispira antarctica TaxID=188908 RepID=A0A1Y5H7X2_OLEAN|nr:dephospho-CoA kinase [Oleispira antarctica]